MFYKLLKTNSALDFLKIMPPQLAPSEGIILDKIQGIVF